tara:strand:+ start:893 stop:1123 length:231 start_codon:yes stop_codon:yes gene_type:complete
MICSEISIKTNKMKDTIFFILLLIAMATAMLIPSYAIMYFFKAILGLPAVITALLTLPFAAFIVYSVIQITDKLIP